MEYKLVEHTNKKGKKVKRYDKLHGKARKEERQEQAKERQAEHDKLTLAQKIAKVVPGRKEHKKLLGGK